VQNIELEHPEYVARRDMWRMYRDLYAGGEQLKGNAQDYLTRRVKEPMEVYGERLSKVFYENYVGSIIDWYGATLFRREPVLEVQGRNEYARRFFNQFADDCDLKGSSLSEFFRRQVVEMLVSGSSYILVDFPIVEGAENRAEEELSGAARAYLVEYSPSNIINWAYDEQGNLEWAVVRTTTKRQDSRDPRRWVNETRLARYDKETYSIYRRKETGGELEFLRSGRHGLAKLGRVPLFEMKISDGLWLMNKAGRLQLEHFNKSNALAWALSMGLFAMPVVYSEREWSQVAGESYYIQLGPNDRFGWTEPEGHVYQIASENLARLQEEIYRVCYLMSQGGRVSSRLPQSGLSKQRDYAITQEVLRAYGDTVKDTIKRVLRTIEAAREDGVAIDVLGLDEFDITDFSSDLEDARMLLEMNIPSATFKRQVFKRLAHKYLCDARQEVKDQIAREIEEGMQGD
jgi:hypothetical protein